MTFLCPTYQHLFAHIENRLKEKVVNIELYNGKKL